MPKAKPVTPPAVTPPSATSSATASSTTATGSHKKKSKGKKSTVVDVTAPASPVAASTPDGTSTAVPAPVPATPPAPDLSSKPAATAPSAPLNLTEPTAPAPTPGADKAPPEPDEPPTVNIYPTTPAKSSAGDGTAPSVSTSPPRSSGSSTNAAPTTHEHACQPAGRRLRLGCGAALPWQLLPAEDILYLGDTARVPYGNKSPETIIRYSRENLAYLRRFGVKAVVVACNTASAHALATLQKESDIPVIGVITPGVQAALSATHNRRIGIIGTQGTIQSKAYQNLLSELHRDVVITAIAAPLLVSLVEEDWLAHPATQLILEEYLAPMKAARGRYRGACLHALSAPEIAGPAHPRPRGGAGRFGPERGRGAGTHARKLGAEADFARTRADYDLLHRFAEPVSAPGREIFGRKDR